MSEQMPNCPFRCGDDDDYPESFCRVSNEYCTVDDAKHCYILSLFINAGYLSPEQVEAKCREYKAPRPKGQQAICPDCGKGVELDLITAGWYCPYCRKMHPPTLFEECGEERQ